MNSLFWYTYIIWHFFKFLFFLIIDDGKVCSMAIAIAQICMVVMKNNFLISIPWGFVFAPTIIYLAILSSITIWFMYGLYGHLNRK